MTLQSRVLNTDLKPHDSTESHARIVPKISTFDRIPVDEYASIVVTGVGPTHMGCVRSKKYHVPRLTYYTHDLMVPRINSRLMQQIDRTHFKTLESDGAPLIA